MYKLREEQIDYILNDIKNRGIEIESLQLNLLDHACCIIEEELNEGDDFESFYQKIITRFSKNELKEIEEETICLLTFKHYYAMKKTMITTGTISVAAFITGSIFKIMHWPGAGILLILGIGILSFIFLPLMFILKTKDKSSNREKLLLAVGSVVGILLCLAVLFSIQHWPGSGSGILWLIAIAVSMFVLIPVYFFTGIRNPDTKVNTIVTSIVLVGATGLLFAMVNVRPSFKLTQIKMYSHIQSEELLKKIQSRQKTTSKNNFKLKILAEGINSKCERVKVMILQNSIGVPAIPRDFETKNILMEESNLGNDFSDNGEGIQLLKHIKAEIIHFNNSESISGSTKIPVDDTILNIDLDNIGRYSNFTILNGIVQIQMHLANAQIN